VWAEARRIDSKRIGPGTQNMARGPAMSRAEARRALEAGIEIARDLGDTVDVFGTGDMGIGNTTASAAIAAVITGRAVAEVTGRGTGIDDEQLRHKAAVIQRALNVNRPDAKDGLDVLAKVGGFEIGGLAGLILGLAAQRKPVVLDGFISTAGALVAHALAPAVADYLVAGHRSEEKGHDVMLEHLGKKALLDLGLRLGEGTGAALAMNLMDAAARILTEVATFAEASVSEAQR
jgi:nicotinate-nucleotide--dimethylbenzimidazole phosphoribosyltransferase